MNRKEWKDLCKVDRNIAYHWYNRVNRILKSKEYESLENCDKDAKVIHHLRDTEEQRKYNNEHYEMFGFEIDENGNEVFNYGKYVVFWTKEHHNEYHHCSEETINKHRENSTKMWADSAFKLAHSGKNAKMYGRKLTDEIKHNMSIAQKSWWDSHPEKKLIASDRFKGENNPNYDKPHSEDTKKKMSDTHKMLMTDKRREECKNIILAVREKYIKYKSNGGTMMWNEFQKYLKSNSKIGDENDKT